MAKKVASTKTVTRKTSTKKNTMSVIVDVRVDDLEFLPIPDSDHGFDLKISGASESMSILPRRAFQIDCGFTFDLPKGFVVDIRLNTDLSKRGLIISPPLFVIGENRMNFVGHNIGTSILAFDHGERIGRFWLRRADHVGVKIKS